jgi:hypothetical protein
MRSACPTPSDPGVTAAARSAASLVSIRLTQEEIEKLAARGYLTEPGLPLGAVVETFISDTLAQMTVTP